MFWYIIVCILFKSKVIILGSNLGLAKATYIGLYDQDLTSWSHSGDEIVFIVAAIDDLGKYDSHIINSDGTNNCDITPDYFPNDFLCRSAVFSNDDSVIYFIGEWWE